MKLSQSLTLIFTCIFLSAGAGCSQINLASHVAKKVNPPAKTQGSFKVGSPYKIAGRYYYPKESYDLVEKGISSWYGPNFHGKQTANGETFDMYELTAAHRTLQLPSLIRVTNLENGRSLVLRVNDRGPFSKGRVLDVSKRAAQILGYEKQGTAKVKIEVLKEESKYIASVAKSGKDTSGYEIALNKPNVSTHSKSVRVASSAKRAAYKAQNNSYQNTATAPNSYSRTSTSPYAPQRIEPAAGRTSANGVQVQRVESQPLSVSTETGLKRVTPGRVDNGNFYPDPVINEVPVTDSKIFIQAGSFSNLQNAENLKAALSKYSQTGVFPVHVNGKQFYRVRLGPISSVDNADRVLASMSNAGHTNAIIIVD